MPRGDRFWRLPVVAAAQARLMRAGCAEEGAGRRAPSPEGQARLRMVGRPLLQRRRQACLAPQGTGLRLPSVPLQAAEPASFRFKGLAPNLRHLRRSLSPKTTLRTMLVLEGLDLKPMVGKCEGHFLSQTADGRFESNTGETHSHFQRPLVRGGGIPKGSLSSLDCSAKGWLAFIAPSWRIRRRPAPPQ